MVTQVRKWGNSLAVRLPKPLAQTAALKPGSAVTIEARSGQVTITLVRSPKYRLEDLVRGITKKNRHPLLFDDRPRGREVW